jgi:ssDNA thymidine ADP-ribosyltransferase DarT-like protein
MQRDDLQELHYIAPMQNLLSIMNLGLLSNRRSKAVDAISIALESVQDRRAVKRVPGGRPLHEYVNLYINAQNPMLFRRINMHGTICVLSVSPAVLDLPGVVVTDQNAASNYVRFAGGANGLAIVDGALTFAEFWTHPEDAIQEWRHKSAMCAEVLVPDVVPPRFVTGAYVSGPAAARNFGAIGLALGSCINRALFFNRG